MIEEKPPGISTKKILLSLLAAIGGLTIFLIGSYQWLHETSAKQDTNTRTLAKVETAATLALSQATHDHAFIYAVCSRFNIDEALSEKQTSDLMAVEKQYTHKNSSDTAYHTARANILAQTDVVRKARIKVECNKAMQHRIATAPTLGPDDK